MFGRTEELLETDLSFLAVGELLLTVVLLFTVLLPLLRCVVDLVIVLFLPPTLLLLDAVLLETLLLFLGPSFLLATDLLDLRLF